MSIWKIIVFAIANQNRCHLRCPSKRGTVSYDRGERHDKHCSEPEQDFLVSTVLIFWLTDDAKHHLWVYLNGQGCHGEPTSIASNYTVQLADDIQQNCQKKLRRDVGGWIT